MAIAFGRAATLTATATPIAPAIVLNAGETGVVFVTLTPASCAVTAITGGGTWVKRGETINGSVKVECWSTGAGAALAATSVSVAISGAITDADVQVLAYTGALGLGSTNTNTGTSAAGTIALATQDANNWVVAGIGILSTALPTNTVGTNRLSDNDVAIGAGASDNTAASAGTVTNTYTNGNAAWAAFALELRTVAASASSGIRLTRYVPGRRGPQSRRGPILNSTRNAAYAVTVASAALTGTCRAAGLLLGAALSTGLTLTPAPVRAQARAGSAAITQAQPVAGTLRTTPRVVGALSVALSIAGTSRVVARVPGFTLAQSVAVAGVTRTVSRLRGAALTQAQTITSTARAAPRLGGALAQAQSIGSTVRSTARLPGVALSVSVPGATAITGMSRASARLTAATLTQAIGVAGRLRATGRTVGQLAQSVPVRGTTRATPRLAGALAQTQAVRSTVRESVLLLGALATSGGTGGGPARGYEGTVTTEPRLTGSTSSRTRLIGAVVIRRQPSSDTITSTARLVGAVTLRARLTGTITIRPES